MLRQLTAIAALVATALSVGDAAHFHVKVAARQASATTANATATANATTTAGKMVNDTSNTWTMKPVTSVQARVQGDMPFWDATSKTWLSKFGATTADKYRSALDTANTATVEGALMYVQAEGINVKEQSVKCQRKYNMQYVVFYELTIVQPTVAIAASQDHTPVEYTAFVAMDGGKCTDVGTDIAKECKQYYGLGGELALGPSVGAELKASDARAPYPNNYWFSFPNSCADVAREKKTDACRAAHPGGLCPLGTAPDGVTCAFAYKILGFINLDDLVGITNLTSKATGAPYTNYTEFCTDGGVEFSAVNSNGFTVDQALPFWKDPSDEKANVARSTAMVELYNKLAPAAKVGTMTPLPAISDLTKANPKCYENSEKCATAKFGCKRVLYAQLCDVCTAAGDGCEVAPASFKYPKLASATLAPTPAPKKNSGGGKDRTTSGSGSSGDKSKSDSKSDSKESAAVVSRHGATLVTVAFAVGAAAVALL